MMEKMAREKKEQVCVRRKENAKCGEKCRRERLPDKWQESDTKLDKESQRERRINTLG